METPSVCNKSGFGIVSSRTMICKTRLDFHWCFFPVSLIGLKKFATHLPNHWLAETPQALLPRRLGRKSAERERISERGYV
ncbi:hypothetical protein P4601_21675, partial [Peribacillus frigoritolerans]|uniref:hypothetical protein n=1 Tax=Peribacillus frigoritolerans TaxID=450367 RepID=UPI002E1F07D7|nr:hypothetical protein [Peribacillus frigoritolerans]